MADTDQRYSGLNFAAGANVPGQTDNINRITTSFHDNAGRHKFTGTTVASAATIAIPDDQNYFSVTGTTTIIGISSTSSGGSALDIGIVVYANFGSALTLTHNGVSFIMPNAADLDIVANDIVGFINLGSGNWQVVSHSNYKSTNVSVADISKLAINRASVSTISVTANNIPLFNTAGQVKQVQNATYTINIGATGADGLDASDTEAASTFYYIWSIAKSDGTHAGFLSSQYSIGNIGTWPTGYSYGRVIGFVLNDASSNFVDFKQNGRTYWYTTPQSGAVTAGSNLDLTTPTPLAPTASGFVAELLLQASGNGGFSFDGGANTHVQYSTGALTHGSFMPPNGNVVYVSGSGITPSVKAMILNL